MASQSSLCPARYIRDTIPSSRRVLGEVTSKPSEGIQRLEPSSPLLMAEVVMMGQKVGAARVFLLGGKVL